MNHDALMLCRVDNHKDLISIHLCKNGYEIIQCTNSTVVTLAENKRQTSINLDPFLEKDGYNYTYQAHDLYSIPSFDIHTDNFDMIFARMKKLLVFS